MKTHWLRSFTRLVLAGALACATTASVHSPASAQDRSVKPGINDSFRDPNVKDFVGRFEIESREVYARRQEIVAACELKPGQTIADIGAGTGLFTRLFSQAVGKDGRVIAVDITPKFLEHIRQSTREAGLTNIDTLQCTADSTELPPNSVDVAFICDTYHHFEFPLKTMTSLVKALKPGGRVILIDFRREEGKSTEWILNHVRAGQEVFEREATEAGLKKVSEERELLKENYFVVFEKAPAADKQSAAPRGPGRGRGMGLGRGPGVDMRADQDVFHYLLEHHAQIRRSVKQLDDGVETLTESDNPEVAGKIQEHVASMHKRVKEGRGLRFWDELFVTLFDNYKQITMVVEDTDHGVRVRETSNVPFVARLIQAHAEVVSLFVKRGFDEAHENHPVPVAQSTAGVKASPPLHFPIILKYGGVKPLPDAVEQPRAGAKVVFDVTADSKPDELNKGLERAARLLNLYGAAKLKATDVKIVAVLHGEATKAVLTDAAYESRTGHKTNPNLPLIAELRNAGVDVQVCGQALNYKGIADSEVADKVAVAVSALTVLVNRQANGFAYAPVP